MLKKPLALSIALVTVLAANVQANIKDQHEDTPQTQSTPSDAALSSQQSTLTRAGMRNAINQTVAKLRLTPNILWTGYGEASVDVPPTHTAWGKYRTLAYQKSVHQAENNYLKEFGTKASSEKVSSYFNNGEFEAPDFDLSQSGNDEQWSRLLNKIIAASEGKVDEVLTELGIDPDKFNATPPEQRHVEFRNNFQRTITREAFANLSGTVTYKTFEGLDEKGNYHIASVLVLSEKMKQLSHDILHSKGDLKANPEHKAVGSLEKLIERDPKSLTYDFGVRRLYDAQGYPILVSFGQWSVSYKGDNPRKQARKEEGAFKQAEAQADADLIEFLKSNATFADENTVNSLIEEATAVNQDNFKRDDNVTALNDITREKAAKKSKVSIIGLAELRRWSHPHPDNSEAELVGVIRYWSPANEQKMRKIAKWKPKPKHAAKASAKSSAQVVIESGIKASDEMMDAHDF